MIAYKWSLAVLPDRGGSTDGCGMLLSKPAVGHCVSLTLTMGVFYKIEGMNPECC